MKDELRTDGDPIAWQAWSPAQNQLWQLSQPAPPLELIHWIDHNKRRGAAVCSRVPARGGYGHVT